jgi:hypothetical protein
MARALTRALEDESALNARILFDVSHSSLSGLKADKLEIHDLIEHNTVCDTLLQMLSWTVLLTGSRDAFADSCSF